MSAYKNSRLFLSLSQDACRVFNVCPADRCTVGWRPTVSDTDSIRLLSQLIFRRGIAPTLSESSCGCLADSYVSITPAKDTENKPEITMAFCAFQGFYFTWCAIFVWNLLRFSGWSPRNTLRKKKKKRRVTQ